ncbi:hypothetical protein PAXRUDRAFT_151345 [Paxillus rubicundulus Ve08.2h10]|uniref:Unplaced genomic scaffold scaffold_660, whole genome shotgun sequence n=1 Tax=Paxillus rubicundulus Ve08.2h10 TaxID=930991 RepID=A0A0D0D2I4_9AGAM|nr:hypothetical protein PAXRUDRAFT_151345 [Paxillus rubicundulus Ve08.2h10]
MEHAMHLAAKAFLQEICPNSQFKSEEPAPEGVEVEEVEEFEPGGLLGKVLALINQVCLSPQAKTYLETVCKEDGLTPLQLIKWICTQWGSCCAGEILRAHSNNTNKFNKGSQIRSSIKKSLLEDCGPIE